MKSQPFTPTVRPRKGEPVVELAVAPGRALRLPSHAARRLAAELRRAAIEAEWESRADVELAAGRRSGGA